MHITSGITTNISNKSNTFVKDISLLVVPKFTGLSPARKLNISELNIPHGVQLADYQFNHPSKIDLLVGAEVFYELILNNSIKLKNQSVQLRETVFGWIVGGAIYSSFAKCDSTRCHIATYEIEVDNCLRKFWEMEAIPHEDIKKSEEELYCENHFVKTHKRTESGRYIVHLPMKEGVQLSDTKPLAEKRLQGLWKRLENNPELKAGYCDFINEYENLGHMQQIKKEQETETSYYLPHHGVIRADSATTKLRVVFDASAASVKGASLNTALLNGGTVQKDLFSMMLNFRAFRYVFTANIIKMYRQILVEPSQRVLQRILWKRSMHDPTVAYELSTLTYGTKCAPFLATRVLNQLACDEQLRFPRAAMSIINNTYVDDVLTGANSLSEALQLKRELIELLQSAGMEFHKWSANNDVLVDSTHTEASCYSFKEKEESPIKTLGLMWHSKSDCFGFKVTKENWDDMKCTKRKVLSDIARLYDPLRLLGPIVTYAKLFLKKLWLCKLTWDQTIPYDDMHNWKKFMMSLQSVERYRIQRNVLGIDAEYIELHGFADASEIAYGTSLYLRSISKNHQITVRILCSKSRISPVKTVTMPRLELCAAMLLSKLAKWQRVTKSVQTIWDHWYRDYLPQFQNRTKWFFEKANVEKDTLVVVKDNKLPVNHWLLGRIVDVIKGHDDKVRVVTVKTKKGMIKRDISKICVLPINN